MLPFRDILKPATSFHWDDSLFTEIINGVRIFDKTKPTCLATDRSRHGIGFWLFQKHRSCPSTDLFCCHHRWKITLLGSRFTHLAEFQYTPIEGEALAVADALNKACSIQYCGPFTARETVCDSYCVWSWLKQ